MKFSVVIPVYNKAETINKTILSVLEQSFKDFEIVIVDDGSRDNFEEKLPKHDSIKVFHQENSGVAVARNTGIINSSGEYICFLDADDIWRQNHLKTLHDMMEKYSDCAYFITSHVVVGGNRKELHTGHFLKDFDEDFITDNLFHVINSTSDSIVHTNSICVKKTVFEKECIWFEPGVKKGEDTDVWYRLALKNNVGISKKETTVYQREYSVETKDSFHTQDWIFESREDSIIASLEIKDEVKREVVLLNDRYRMTCSRYYMLSNQRKLAKRILYSIKNKNGKRYVLTKLYTYLPYAVCRYVFFRLKERSAIEYQKG